MSIYCIDVDGTLCTKSEKDYTKAMPYKERIETVNKLYEEGNEIIIFTARGSLTGENWEDLTKKQLKDWNLKYSKLIFGKPGADYYIDDKAVDLFNWFK
tara:strand:- start:42904 stop:43200 length:297 start_codon:yes stop_codon:yes gene_type:complete